jgi:hypothetical protein
LSNTADLEDLGKLEPDALRLNMMITSLYLFAFELLRLSIVAGVKDHFLPQGEYSQAEIDGLKELDSKMREVSATAAEEGASPLQAYLDQLTTFEESIGRRYNTPENHLLLPCAQWLKDNDVISEEDVLAVGRIRDHRNQLAHEMPTYLFQAGHDPDVDLLAQVGQILRKVDLFWFRMDLHFDPATLEEIDTSHIPDEEVFSSREAFLSLASNAVIEYAQQFGSHLGDAIQ